jgi:hypothetical protein
MLDILAKFDLKIEMVTGEFEELNKLELRYEQKYSKTVDYDFKKLINLTSEDILELFGLVILIEPSRMGRYSDDEYDKSTRFILKDGDVCVSSYVHPVIVIPDSNRIINNTPEKDPYSVISLTYL